ncbi:hypothetical protein BYT27DRAFT_7201970, partial [Phlegmacium glaucopus]
MLFIPSLVVVVSFLAQVTVLAIPASISDNAVSVNSLVERNRVSYNDWSVKHPSKKPAKKTKKH